MAIKKKKISELTLSDNLKGLYTIGVKLINGVQTSVKVSLEYIQTAYENAVKATNSANEAAKSATMLLQVPTLQPQTQIKRLRQRKRLPIMLMRLPNRLKLLLPTQTWLLKKRIQQLPMRIMHEKDWKR